MQMSMDGCFGYLLMTSGTEAKRRYYFVLDETSWNLFYFDNEKDFVNNSELGFINMQMVRLLGDGRHLSSSVPSSVAHIDFRTIDGVWRRLEVANTDDEQSICNINDLRGKLETFQLESIDDQVFLCAGTNFSSDVNMTMEQLSNKMTQAEGPKSLSLADDSKRTFRNRKMRNSTNSMDKRSLIISSSIEEEEDFEDSTQQACKLDFGGPSGLAIFEQQPVVSRCSSTSTNNSYNERHNSIAAIEWAMRQDVKIDTKEEQQSWVRNWIYSQENSKKRLTSSVSMEEEGISLSFRKNQFLNKRASLPVRPLDQSIPSSTLSQDHRSKSLNSDEQLAFYKQNEKKQRFLVQQLSCRVNDLQRQLEQTQRLINQAPELHLNYLQQKNKTLNAEIVRLSSKYSGDRDEYAKCSRKVACLSSELEQFKLDYVLLLQTCIRVLLIEKHKDGSLLKLCNLETHKSRICRLCEEVKQEDTTFSTFGSVISENGYIDIYGFRHAFSDDILALHYLSGQLRMFYGAQNGSQNRHLWKLYIRRLRKGLVSRKELRNLIKSGVPNSFRSLIWRSLVHQRVADIKEQYGKYYFNNLCSPHGENMCHSEADILNLKQITLDIMRTMPSNVHFANITCKGVNQLQQVLRAFCCHNPHIGYCQGMNFLAAVALLFMSAEDTFWFLVAITERYFSPNYFDQNLIGVQTDQEVLKWLVERKLPALSQHMALCDIDLATITLNWFMALFFDSLPFEIMLRIWDCFLLDGPKVLFRYALAVLSMHQDVLLEKHDTMSILKVLKLSTKYTYDADALTKIAYEAMDPFPNRTTIIARQISYLKVLKERMKQREQYKVAALSSSQMSDSNQLYIDRVVWTSEEYIIITFGNRDNGQLGIVKKGSNVVQVINTQFNCRILSIASNDNTVFVALISGYLAALKMDIAQMTSQVCWESKLSDMAFDLQLTADGRLLAALANGSLAILDNCASGVADLLELYYVPIGPAPLCCLMSDNEGQIWASMGCQIHILSDQTLDCTEKFVVPNNCHNPTSVFEKLVGLQLSDRGIWLAVCQTSIVQLWDTKEFICKLFYDVGKDCLGTFKRDDDPAEIHITSLLAFDDNLWIGTDNGYLLTYKIIELPLVQTHPPLLIRQGATHFFPPTLVSTVNSRNSPICTTSLENSPESERIIGFPIQIPATADSGYNSVASSSTSSKSGMDRRLSRSFPSFSLSKLVNQWHSYDSLFTICSASTATDINPVGMQTDTLMTLVRPQLSWPQCTVSLSVGSKANGVEKPRCSGSEQTPSNKQIVRRPFQETLNRRRKTVGSCSCSLFDGDNPVGEAVAPSSFADSESTATISIRKSSHCSTVPSSSSPNLEFDDLFFVYDEETPGHEAGLCAAQFSGKFGSPSSFYDRTTAAATCSNWLLDLETPFAKASENAGVQNRAMRDQATTTIKEADVSISDTSATKTQTSFVIPGSSKSRPLSLELRRKVLKPDDAASNHQFLEADELCIRKQSNLLCSETTSVVSSLSVDAQYSFNLSLKMRLKISDQPVNSMARSESKIRPKIVTCSGLYGSTEGLLLWSPEDGNKFLWYNEPITTMVEKKRPDKTRRRSSLWFR